MSHRLFGYFFFFLAAAFFGAGAGAFAIAGCAATGLSVFLVANFIRTPFLTLCFFEAAFLVATAFSRGQPFSAIPPSSWPQLSLELPPSSQELFS